MTKEEAIKVLNTLKTDFLCGACSISLKECDYCVDCLVNKALEIAIKSLEQELSTDFINKPCISIGVCHEDKIKVLDEIRAEIEQNAYPIVHGINNHELGMTLYGILQVIDKYKAESEEKE